jgi:hypothetical protein
MRGKIGMRPVWDNDTREQMERSRFFLNMTWAQQQTPPLTDAELRLKPWNKVGWQFDNLPNANFEETYYVPASFGPVAPLPCGPFTVQAGDGNSL